MLKPILEILDIFQVLILTFWCNNPEKVKKKCDIVSDGKFFSFNRRWALLMRVA